MPHTCSVYNTIPVSILISEAPALVFVTYWVSGRLTWDVALPFPGPSLPTTPLEARFFVVSPLHSFSSAPTPPDNTTGIFFSPLSWSLEPGSASLLRIRSSPRCCVPSWREPRFVC